MGDKKKSFKEGGVGSKIGNFLRSIDKESILGVAGVATSLLSGNIGGALNSIKNLVDGDTDMTEAQKFEANRLIDLDIAEAEQVTKRWEADMISDSWMSKNIRPLALAFLTLSLAVYIVLDSSLEGFEVKSEWVSLLSSLLLLVYGAYFGMRGLEKIQKIRKK